MTSIVAFDEDSIPSASALVASGGLIVYPTDTVYGLGCDPHNEKAVRRLFEAKRRDASPVPILCDGIESALRLVEMNPRALKLAERHWPGALTIVATLKVPLPFPLHQGTGTLGVRVPGSELCLRLITECGGQLTGTSANLSGAPSSRTALEARRQLGDTVDLVLDGGRLEGLESTVIRVTGEKIEAIRRGPVGVSEEADTG
ncbi:MAG: L-threonylcarbamoyladenylate synthase [Thaumarchaeota archaeon]|nr:L-threonylcarbamoyladenylate synthase [Nitrososphaerota archaeon]